MDLNNINLFGMIKKQMTWLSQRQEVLAQNIANADTPKYRPQDLRKFDFKELIRREKMQLNMAVTGANHLPGQRKRIRDFSAMTERSPYETAPDGNAVVIEEQMAKVNETNISHKLMTDLYRKHLNMLRTAIGRGR